MVFYRTIFLSFLLFLLSLSLTQAQHENSLRTTGCRFERNGAVEIECYYLTVPENRSIPDSNTITIAIAILRHPSGNPDPDPIIFLQGGPGGATLENLYLTYRNRFEPLFATNRDIILFDQRGIGHSRPALDCRNYRLLEIDLLDFEHDGQTLTRPEITEAQQSSLVECGQSLNNLHDLSAYNSVENAADIDAIRQAFGYEQVNLWGISYGTRLALTAMRDYPDSFRRVVLDSVYPLEANLYTELPVNFDRALHVLFENCALDEACNTSYPDLEQVLFDTVTQLNQQAIRFDAPDPYSNRIFAGIIFDGDMMLRTVFQLLYSSDILPRLPELIYQASESNFDLWLVLVGWLTANRDTVDIGMHYAVQCQEEFIFTADSTIREAWSAFPHFDSYSQMIYRTGDIRAICTAFNAGTSPLIENQAVSSEIPALIIAGEYDPITPPQWAMQVHEQTGDSIYLELPHRGHGASGSTGCAQSMVIDYFVLEDVSQLDTTCIDSIDMVFSGTQQGDFNPPDSAKATSINTQ